MGSTAGSETTIIPERLFRILRSAESADSACFPRTEVFNEGWMLRLLLDAVESSGKIALPLQFEPEAGWYSEARLASPFAAQQRADALAEGFTNADGVISQFAFRSMTRAGFELATASTQFVVVEAKMFSNLSSGTRNAPAYNQAARNVACMAYALARAGRRPESFSSLGFYVVAPMISKRRPGISNLEESLEPDKICAAVRQRIGAYEAINRVETATLRSWEAEYFLPLVQRLSDTGGLKVLTWESCLDAISAVDRKAGEELGQFYDCCLSFVGP